MEQFNVNFKSEEESKYFSLVLLLGIIFGFLPSIITIFLFPEKFTKESLDIIKAVCNFELVLFIFMLIIGVVPIVNILAFLISPVVWIANLIIILRIFTATKNSSSAQVPVIFKFF